MKRTKSSETLKMTIKRLPDENDEKLNPKSPGRWTVRLPNISEDNFSSILNSIENNSPKRSRQLLLDEHTPVKKNKDVGTPKSTRRSRSAMKAIDEEEDDDKKTLLKKINIVNDSNPSTPTTKGIPTRRKSILKTPTVQKTATPRRSIQFSGIVEEYEYVKKSSKDKVIKAEEIDASSLADARKRLHVSAIPDSLPCREKEYLEIYSFLEGNIADGIGGCMYVSGVPGTGKTATTTAVVRALKVEAEKGKIPDFEFVEINGMKITEPRKAYVEIHRQLTGKTVTAEQAYNLLDKRFSNSSSKRGRMTVLLVDELDILCNKRQDVVYNLLNWPNLNSARLIVVTIANTMDLPERILMGKVTSRLGLTRLTFQPYSHKQLQEIVVSRLSGLDSFNKDAIQLVARKVAALSGDARRALDICRRSSEIAEADGSAKAFVSMTHVQQALNEMISCTKVKAIKACSKMEKYFLQAVCMEVERTGIEEVTFHGVYGQFKTITVLNGAITPSSGAALSITTRLNASRLIISEHTLKDLYMKILLNISIDDFYYATQMRDQES